VIDQPISCPLKYQNYHEGWYLEEEAICERIDDELEPPFFKKLILTVKWEEFENYTHLLLKLLGLHNLYMFRAYNQRGRADGFFIFNNLVVLFDMTLECDFESKKEEQIENFCSQLNRGKIEFNNRSFNILNHLNSMDNNAGPNNSRILKNIDTIIVKEVPIAKLFEIYRKRLLDELDEVQFQKELVDL